MAHLPHQVTSMRLAPIDNNTSPTSATIASRNRAAATSHQGTDPSTITDTRPVISTARSLIGSSILPTLLTELKRRAHHPSTQSVTPSIPHSSAAPQRSSKPNSSHRNQGTHARRAAEIRLGTVNARSCEPPADASGEPSQPGPSAADPSSAAGGSGVDSASMSVQGDEPAAKAVAASSTDGETIGQAPTSVFSRIIDGEIPGRFVYSDDVCAAFMDVRPLNRGHVLVVPRVETDHWTALDEQTLVHLVLVAQRVARAQQDSGLAPGRVGLMIAGFEVPHVHLHVVPIETMEHLDFAQADTAPDPDDLDAIAAQISASLDLAQS